jgi:hypothetical protein
MLRKASFIAAAFIALTPAWAKELPCCQVPGLAEAQQEAQQELFNHCLKVATTKDPFYVDNRPKDPVYIMWACGYNQGSMYGEKHLRRRN